MVNVVCPLISRVPCEESEEVAAITPPVVIPTVRVLILALVAVMEPKIDVTAFNSVAKKFVEVALLITPLVE